ncbi:preprotein translocase subunit SecF [Methanocaldococcus villosus KIN24-T80]|uniref:Protein-export membrane protein SecF n=2 Tax=Methanocaldococcus villosus TaxID=667126 RepID=N6VZU9_9EURY|nr:preprotein translocase subunit SecF [Methanocaldococcus villosus KIN24-T80]
MLGRNRRRISNSFLITITSMYIYDFMILYKKIINQRGIMLIKDYKVAISVPIFLIFISLMLITLKGIPKSIDITGGTEITIKLNKDIDLEKLKEMLKGEGELEILKSASGNYLVIRCKSEYLNDVKAKLREFFGDLNKLDYSEKTVGSVLSKKFFEEGGKAMLFAFIFMALAVYIAFRKPLASGVIILSALADLINTLGAMSLLNIQLSTATIAALLMVLGYSVDSNILLTTRVLKRTKDFDTAAKEAMKTGLTMITTTIVAMLILYIVVKLFIPVADVLATISSIIIIALLFDIINTWMLNAGILKAFSKA